MKLFQQTFLANFLRFYKDQRHLSPEKYYQFHSQRELTESILKITAISPLCHPKIPKLKHLEHICSTAKK